MTADGHFQKRINCQDTEEGQPSTGIPPHIRTSNITDFSWSQMILATAMILKALHTSAMTRDPGFL